MTVPLRLNASLLIFLVSNTRTPWFAIDGSFFTASTELPDIFTKNTSKCFQKGHKSYSFIERMASGNAEIAIYLWVRKTMMYARPFSSKELVFVTHKER